MPDVSPFVATEKWILGEFHIEGILGEGGSGTVYAATFHGGAVALKVLRPELSLSDRERKRFLEESARMRRVEHAGLVAMMGEGVLDDGRPYICMPRLEGETLASRLVRGPLPLEIGLAVFQVMAEAVSTLHAAGLIHRDIKPENIFLQGAAGPSQTPRPVLLDLGIARDVTEADSTTTVAGQVRGTPAYMAPERFFGSPATVRSDVYELAVTLYMMLVGRRPWESAQDAAARLAPIHPRDAGVDVPPDLVTVLLRALSTRPEVRPASAREFGAAVRAAAVPRASSDRAPTETLATVPPPPVTAAAVTPSKEAPPSWQHGVLPWAGGIVGGLGLLGMVVLVRAWEQPSPATTGPTEPPSIAPDAARALPSASSEVVHPPSPVTAPGPSPEASVSSPRAPSVSRMSPTPRPGASTAPPPAASSAAATPATPDRYYLDRK
jgi:eukaryotic-like serine/threonine-protein kinase